MKATWVKELIHHHLLFQSLLRGLPTASLSPSYPDYRPDVMESKDLPEKFVRKNLNSIKIVGTFYTNACDRSFWTLKEPHLLFHSVVRSFVRSSTHPSIHPFIQSFNHPFIFPFIHPIYLFKHVSGIFQITLLKIIYLWISYLCSTYISSGLQAQLHDLKNTTKRDVDVVWRYSSLRGKVLSCSTVKFKQEEISKQNRTVLYRNWVQDPYFNDVYLPTFFSLST